MTWDFLKKVKPSSLSVKLAIHQRLAGFEKARPHFPLRASDLLKQDYEFCPREHAFMDMGVAQKKDQFVGTAQRMTFDHGHYMEDQIRNNYLRDIAVGNWKCSVCGKMHPTFGKFPKVKCHGCGWYKWVYEEVRFEDDYTGVSGGIDLLLENTNPKLAIVEIKTMAPDPFKELVAPLSEHKARTTLYMRLAELSKVEHSERVNVMQAHVIYAMKSFGVKDTSLKEAGLKDSAFSPFKEFVIDRDDTILSPYLAKARVLKVWRDTKQGMPCGICPNGLVKRAQSCSAVGPCFSGKYQSTLTWPALGGPKHPGKTVVE